jgi:thymidylate synthase
VNIWNDDAYRWYLKKFDYQDNLRESSLKPYDKENFLRAVQEQELCPIHGYEYGDLGKVYGHQWRNQNGVDQVKDVIEGLKKNPYSRYQIIDAWNKADFNDMALPPCHLLYQFIVRPLSLKERLDYHFNVEKGEFFLTGDEKETIAYLDACDIPKFYLDLNMYQRSCDSFLGVPFNIASMSLLLKIFARASNMLDGVARWIGGDTHLYVNHIELAKEQISRIPLESPQIFIKKELKSLDDILALTIEDFELVGYKSHPAIKAELFTGLKK